MKTTLRGVKPAVWRRVEIPGTTNLPVCNAIIIAAMGWSGYHLYEFQSSGRTFGEPHVEWEQDNLDASKLGPVP
ncbi:MAG: IS1096 element passenger TnpR family protein [Candidatus Nanopelagicales bacterium]